jgi:hypothetical protein
MFIGPIRWWGVGTTMRNETDDGDLTIGVRIGTPVPVDADPSTRTVPTGESVQ